MMKKRECVIGKQSGSWGERRKRKAKTKGSASFSIVQLQARDKYDWGFVVGLPGAVKVGR
jgi:hypothetical protein